MSWFKTPPPESIYVRPTPFPKVVVPSFIGENGQVLNMLMEHGAGTIVRDYSGLGNHGVFAVPPGNPAWIDGSFGWATSFDGGDSINAGADLSLDLPASDHTLEAWLNPSNALATQAIIGKLRFMPHSWGIYQNAGRLQYQYRGAGVGVDTIADNVYTVGTWYHVIATRNVNTNNLYINSVIQADVDVSVDIPITAANNFYIGRRVQDNLFNFNGLVGISRFYNRAFGQPEISRHFESTRGIFGV